MSAKGERRAEADLTEEAGIVRSAGAMRSLPPLGILAEWRRLAEGALESNPFFSQPLVRAAFEHLAGKGVRLAAPTDEGGRMVALAPICAMRLGRLVPAVSVWTHLYGPFGTPLLDPEHPGEAVRRLIDVMEGGRPGRSILVFPDLPADGPVARALLDEAAAGGRRVAWLATYPRAVLVPADVSGSSLRAVLPAKIRKDLARQMRRLAETGTLRIERITDPARLPAALDEFLALEASGWKGRRGTALARLPEALAFARTAVLGGVEGEVAIDALRLDEAAIAMLISFRSGDVAVTWKIAHDERFARFSPGVQVMVEGSDAILADPAVRLVDSLASADHPMVDRLWPARRSVGTLIIGPKGGSLAFRTGVALARAEVAARQRLRKALQRIRARRMEKEVPS